MRPNDERHFLHKRIIGIAESFLPGGGIPRQIIEAIGGGGSGGGGGAFDPITFTGNGGGGGGQMSLVGAPTSTIITFIKNNFSRLSHAALAAITGLTPDQVQATYVQATGGNGCADPQLRRDAAGNCVFPGSPAGGVGEYLKGDYGPAREPFFETRNIRSCNAGQVLGKDKLCYNKGAISNKERLYPVGTRPLLTGGQMRAIGIASAAESKVRTTAVRLGIVGRAPRKSSTPSGHKAKLVHK